MIIYSLLQGIGLQTSEEGEQLSIAIYKMSIVEDYLQAPYS